MKGTVGLALCEGASLTIDGGVQLDEGAALRVYGQGEGLQVWGGSSADDLALLPRTGDGNEYDLSGCACVRIEQATAPVAASVGAFQIVDYTATICVSAPEAATAYFARYDDGGRFLGVETKTIDAGETAELEFRTTSDTRTAKLFLAGVSGQPLCSYQSAAQLENGNTP